MEAKHEIKPSGLRVHIDSNTSDVDRFTIKDKYQLTRSWSSSSCPDSPLDDALSKYECDDYKKGTTLAKLNEYPQSDLNHEENISLTKPIPVPNIKPPSSQAMERPLNSEYKIPPHVFAINKSIAPRDWSIASTDSLFSINVGDYPFSDIKSSENLINMPSKVSERNEDEDESVVESDKSINKPSLTPSVSSTSLSSDVSMSSIQSFAFPILNENNGSDGLTAVDSVRIGFDYPSKQVKPSMPSKPLSQPEPQQQKAESSTCSAWFSCFTCCKS